MTTWIHEHGHLVARNDAGGVLVKLPADRAFSLLADLLNARPDLSRLLLAGYGCGEQKKGPKPQGHTRPSSAMEVTFSAVMMK